MSTNFGFWSYSNHFKNKVVPSIKKNNIINPYSILSRKKILKKNYLKKTEITTNKKRFLKDQNFKNIYISSITKNHFSNILESLNNNKNVICEKPISQSLKELKKILSLSKRKKLKVLEVFNYTHHPLFQKIKKMIKKGEIGEINYIESTFSIPLNDRKNFRFKKELGGGSMMDTGIYPLSIPFFLFKDVRLNLIDKKINYLDNNKKKIDISGSVILKIRNDCFASLNWGFNLPYKNHIFIYGSKGSIESNFIFSKKVIQGAEIKIFKNAKSKKIKIKRFNQINETFNFFFKA